MADNSVFITGANKGAFKDALDGLPPWATEETAEKIEKVLRDTFKLQTKTLTELVKRASSGDNSIDAAALNDELELLVENLHNENAQDPNRRRRNREEADEFGRRKKRWNTDKEQFDSKLFIDTALIKTGLAIKATFENNVKTFNALTEAGINVISGFDGTMDGFQSLRQLTAETGVRYTELAASMTKYSSAVNSFGVGKFAKSVGAAAKGLERFGFNSTESADLLGSYLSIQQNFTDVHNKSLEETTADLTNFGSEIFKVSQATGMSRAAIIANMQALSKSVPSNLLVGQVGEKAAKGMMTFLSSFKDQNLANQILKLATDPYKPLNETFNNLQVGALGGLAQAFTTFTEDIKGMPAEMQAEQFKAFVTANRATIDFEKQRQNALGLGGLAAGKANAAWLASLTQEADAIVELTPERRKELARLEESNEASKKLASAWERLVSTLQRASGPTVYMLNLFSKTLEYAITPINWIVKLVDEFSKGLSSLVKTLGIAETDIDVAAGAGLALIVYGLSKTLTVFGTKLLTIIGFLKDKVFGSAAGGLGGGPGGSGGPGGAGGGGGRGDRGGNASRGPSLLSRIGKGLGDLGKGLGTGLGGLLRNTLGGLADGLKALGNPKVLLGVTALAGIAVTMWVAGKALKEFVGIDWETMKKAGSVIVALGVAGLIAGAGAKIIGLGALALGAMGAALWVIGKGIQEVGPGLESLSKGIASFGKIDGKNLQSVAIGIVALGGALVAFSAGSAISAVGGVFTTLGNGLSKLFGDGSTLDQIKAFASIGPGLQTTVSSLSTITHSLSKLSDTLGTFNGLNTLKSIVQTINSINIAKALAFGVLSKIGVVSLPTPTAPSGASPMTSPKPSTLGSPSDVSSKDTVKEQSSPKDTNRPLSSGKEKQSPESNINNALGYQSSVLEQILLSTNSLVSVNKDILKYVKIQT